MNATIASITIRGLLGRKRALPLFVLPAVLLLLALGLRLTGDNDFDIATTVLRRFALGTLLPLLCLIVGTGVIGPEIDDGQIMYVLTKPIARPVVAVTKFAVAVILMIVFAVLPTLAAGLIMTGALADLAVAFTIGALAGGVCYSAVFVALAVVSRNAVTIGLIYALVWETLMGNFAPGARSLSIQQWALSVADALTSATTLTAEVSFGLSVASLVAVTVLGATLAALRLRSLPIAGAE